jgi:hypothetical protein|tara:strand:+ start:231 stop:815 length:585 start_codon:yes stop_codon:yes gene_type:complete
MNIIDFIKYYPEVLAGDICDQIVLELQNKLSEPDRNVVNFLKIFMKPDDDNFICKYISESIRKTKEHYLNDHPKYAKSYHNVSGEKYGIREDMSRKIIVQYYPTGGSMDFHIDNTGIRRQFMEKNKKILEWHLSQLSCILFLNDNYGGGEFVIADQEYKPLKGSVIFFPSNFMFPHKVNTVKEGTRWTCGGWFR